MQPQRCVETCQEIFTSLKKRTKLHSIRLPMSGCCRPASTLKREESEFVVDSGASMHMVSKTDLNSAELETVRVSKKSDDGGKSQRRRANKRRGNSVCQRIGFIRDIHRLFSHSENSAKNSGTVIIGRVARNHMTSRKARKFIATHQIMYNSLYLVYPRVPLPHQLLLHLHRRKLQQTQKFQQQERVPRK